MIIKIVNEFKLTVFHLRTQTRCKSEHARGFTPRQQNCVGRRAVAGCGPRAAGFSGRRAAGPWRAVGGRGPAFSKTPFKCARSYAKLVFSLLTLARYRDLSDLLRSLIISHVPLQMSFIA